MEKLKTQITQLLSKLDNKMKIIFASVLVILLLVVSVSFGLGGHASPNPDNPNDPDQDIIDVIPGEDDVEDPIIINPDDGFSLITHYNYSPLSTLSFDELSALNEDYAAWISISGTTVNHPVVQGRDNVFYLTNTFEKTNTKYGAIYLDYRNNLNFSDKHIIIYGHHMRDGTMFRDIDKYKNSSYLNGRENIVIRTGTETRTYRIFSAYVGASENMKIVGPTFSKSLDYYLDRYKNRSRYNINTSLRNATQMLTISSCNYDYPDGRVLVHAVLVSVVPNN